MKQGSEWYKRYPLAYLGGMLNLTACQHAVFSVVLDLIYAHGGSINNAPKWISGYICDMGTAAVRNTINQLVQLGKLQIENDQITEKRAKIEAKTQKEVRENCAKNGQKGGKSSGNSRSEVNKSNNMPQAAASHREDEIREDQIKEKYGAAPEKSLSPDTCIPFYAALETLQACAGDAMDASQLSTEANQQEAMRWAQEFGLSTSDIKSVIFKVVSGRPAGPINSLAYFTQAMQNLASCQAQKTSDPASRAPNSPKTPTIPQLKSRKEYLQ